MFASFYFVVKVLCEASPLPFNRSHSSPPLLQSVKRVKATTVPKMKNSCGLQAVAHISTKSQQNHIKVLPTLQMALNLDVDEIEHYLSNE